MFIKTNIMKHYFTKYLPVEGNIFPKDKFIHTLYEGVIHTNEDVTPLKEHPDYKKSNSSSVVEIYRWVMKF